MLTCIDKFIKDSKASLSIEFAGVFFAFILIIFGTYDIYSLITLQNNLESTNYAVASLFRERTSNLYPLIDDTKGKAPSSLCKQIGDEISCYKSYEYFDLNQVQEAQKLASKLLNKDVAVRIDGLFIFQDLDEPVNINASLDEPANINTGRVMSYSFSSCDVSKNACPAKIKEYLDSRSDMADMSVDDKNYTKLVPFVRRVINDKFIKKYGSNLNLTGRFIPLYRLTMCINENKSLLLKLNGNRDTEILPNLCSEVAVLSRCNELLDASEGCPIYIYGDW